jgi:hypothetical protein
MLNIQNNPIKIAKSILIESDREHNSNNSYETTEFLIDSFVLVQQRSAPETRLHTLWRGSMRVLHSTKGEYPLLDLTTNKEKKYHSTQMKQFKFDPLRTDPIDVARKDYLDYRDYYPRIITLILPTQSMIRCQETKDSSIK